MSNTDGISEALRKQLEYAQRLTAQFGKEIEAVRRLNAYFEQVGRQQLEAQTQIEAAMAPFRNAEVQLAKAMLGIEQAASFAGLRFPGIEIPDDLRRHLADLGRIQRLVGDALADLPERTRKELNGLAARGWYIDQEWPASAPADLIEAIEEGQAHEVDDALVGYFREQFSVIKERLIRQYPNRTPFLAKAFSAHQRGDFELSIPVFLAQADGICKDRTNRSMFRRKDKKPEMAAYVEAALGVDEYRAALLSPLGGEHPISLSEAQRPAEFDGLNRHQVLHGESLTYHTEINSLKAVSLLGFLSWVLHMDDEATGQEET